MNIKRSMRKWVALISAIIVYFVIHEGAHAIYAMGIGAFKEINFMIFGIQVDPIRANMTNIQYALFNLLGGISTITIGYVVVLLIDKIIQSNSKYFKAIMYYITISLLIVDPLYLSFMFKYVGGGDMNGITYLIPQSTAQVVFGIISIINIVIIFKYVIPKYKKSYLNE